MIRLDYILQLGMMGFWMGTSYQSMLNQFLMMALLPRKR